MNEPFTLAWTPWLLPIVIAATACVAALLWRLWWRPPDKFAGAILILSHTTMFGVGAVFALGILGVNRWAQ